MEKMQKTIVHIHARRETSFQPFTATAKHGQAKGCKLRSSLADNVQHCLNFIPQ